jgi:hypothetical protein
MINFLWMSIALTAIVAVQSVRGLPLISIPDAFNRQAATVSPGSADARAPIRSVAEISDPAKVSGLVGRDVMLRDVRVIRTAGPRSFWIEGSEGRRVFVVVDAMTLVAAAGSAFGSGDEVSIEGSLKPVPGHHGQMIEDWGRLDEDDATALEKQVVYVYAKHVHVTGREQP